MGAASSRDHDQVQQPHKRICIIGAGSSSLVALKVIKETKEYKSREWSVVAYEARDGIGGIWCVVAFVNVLPLG